MQFKKLPPSQGNKNYLKIDPSKSIVGVFRGNPSEFDLHWVAGKGERCAGQGCGNCGEGVRRTFRFGINFVTQENGAWVAKVFEQGRTVYENLSGLAESGYDLEKTKVTITRNGSGTDTTYTILPLPPPRGVLTEKELEQVNAVKLEALANEAEVPF